MNGNKYRSGSRTSIVISVGGGRGHLRAEWISMDMATPGSGERQNIGAVNSFEYEKGGQSTSN